MIPHYIEISEFILKKGLVDNTIVSNKQVLADEPVAINTITGKSYLGKDRQTLFVYIHAYNLIPEFYTRIPINNIFSIKGKYFIKNQFVLKVDSKKSHYAHNVKNNGNAILFFDLWAKCPTYKIKDLSKFVIKTSTGKELEYKFVNEKYGSGVHFGLLGMQYRDLEKKQVSTFSNFLKGLFITPFKAHKQAAL